jgi:STE24 endopeptidase
VRVVGRVTAAISFAIRVAVILGHVAPNVIDALGVRGWFLELLVAVAVVQLVELVIDLPVSAWRELSYDRRWGFSTQTLKGWIVDAVKAVPLGIVLLTLIFAPLWAVIRATPAWWLWGWAVFAVVQVTVGVLYPIVIFPLFNKFTPLEEGPLRDEIFATARRIGADINEVLVQDVSKRDRRPNAYVAGLGKVRRVVLFDNMLERPSDEVISVVAHELGHWKLRHIWRQIPLAIAISLVPFAFIKLVLEREWALDAAGVESLGDPGSFPLFLLGFTVVSAVTKLVPAWLSRAYERQADLFSLSTTNNPSAFVSAFKNISTENLLELTPSWWKRVNHSHPPFAERMAMGRAWEAANRG